MTITTDTVTDELARAQDYASGAEGIWIDEDDWLEQATYERDTNAWVNDPYDRISSADIAADGAALAEAILALDSSQPHPLDDHEQIDELRTRGQDFAQMIIETSGDPRDARGYRMSTPDIAETLHTSWTELESVWLYRSDR